MTTGNIEDVIELRVDEIAQLFHTLDPFPFRERDLDREAEDFIVGWARELPVDQPIKIVIHFPDSVAQTHAAGELGNAFSRYFSHRAVTSRICSANTGTSATESGASGCFSLSGPFDGSTADLPSAAVRGPASRLRLIPVRLHVALGVSHPAYARR